ncbi:hypothetical protein SEHO0A_03216 [Salmonella enterica subsp. houtenae str. ATCC BAA-1581]|nr:hypothetical protein SEHO0A_03216 [Salmonella enterica subsp. houtenae str. ATCC BAA-1581]ENZ85457.1 hypothetical protein D088_700047 [Salmonella enterica subsp. houtenae serovar 16:z4,z32:-- str. RKS3027]
MKFKLNLTYSVWGMLWNNHFNAIPFFCEAAQNLWRKEHRYLTFI